MEKLSKYIANASLILFPGGILGVNYLSGAIFLLLFLAGTIQSFKLLNKKFALSSNEIALFFSVSFLSISTFLISYINDTGLDRAQAFIALLLVVPIYIFFKENLTTDKYLWPGLMLGAFIGLLVSIYQVSGVNGVSSRAGGVTNPIIFGDLALMMGFLSMASYHGFKWSENKALALLPVLALFSGLIASALSMSRGGWVAIPILFIVYAWYSSKFISLKLLAIGLLVMLGGIGILYIAPQTGLQDRVELTSTNIVKYFDSEQVDDPARVTSIGTRLEMWKSAWMVFLEHPVLGGGWANYQENTQKLIDKGYVNSVAAETSHPHNQFLSSLAKGGGIGFVATVILFLFPAIIFYRVMRLDTDLSMRNVGLAGLIFVIAFFIFNLTETFLERSRPVMFFAFYLAVFFALIEIKTAKAQR